MSNVGVTDFVDGNRTCILGFIWQLVSHYQLKPTMAEVPREAGWKAKPVKHQLMKWVRLLLFAS